MNPYAQAAPSMLEAGLGVIPLIPGEKRPGVYESGHWRGMTGWQGYSKRMPEPEDVRRWLTWPGAGIGLPLGEVCRVVALDFDGGPPEVRAAIEAMIPAPASIKIGAKGYTSFYLYEGQISRKWTIGNESVCELLSTGRQTVLPPSLHPNGCHYRWEGKPLHEAVMQRLLPRLPADFDARVSDLVSAWNIPAPRQASVIPIRDERDPSQYFRETNDRALQCLDAWVPGLLGPNCKPSNGGYRAIAVWRGGDGWNVGIHPSGIEDFARGTKMTAIDLAAALLNQQPVEATEWLRRQIVLPSKE